MLKNNSEKMNRNKFKFGIRRLSVGTASVLLGVGIATAIGTTNVFADEVTSPETTVSEVTNATTAENDTPTTKTADDVKSDTTNLDTAIPVAVQGNDQVVVAASNTSALRGAVVSTDPIQGNGKNTTVNTTDDVVNIDFGASITTDKNDTTLKGDKAILDMSKAQDGEFYIHLAFKNNGTNDVKILDTVDLPSSAIINNPDADQQIQPRINITKTDLENLTMGLEDETLTYRVPNGQYLQASVVKDTDVPDIHGMQIIGTLKAGEERHLYIPFKVNNYQEIIDNNSLLSYGQLRFSFSNSILYFRQQNGGPAVGWYGNIKSAGFQGAATEPATAFMDTMNNIAEGKTEWPAEILTFDGTNKVITPVTDPALKNVHFSKDDIIYENDPVVQDVIGQEKDLYLGGHTSVSLENVFKQISNLGYTVMPTLVDGKLDILPKFIYGVLKNPAKKDIPYFYVQKVLDTQDFVTEKNGAWVPTDNLKDAQIQATYMSLNSFENPINIKEDNLYGYKIYLTSDMSKPEAQRTVIASSEGGDDNKKSVTLPFGDYTVVYSYKINDTHVVTNTAKITVPAPDTSVIPLPGDNNSNLLPDNQENQNNILPESQEQESYTDKDGKGKDSVLKDQNGNNVVFAATNSATTTGKSSATQLPQTGENDSKSVVLSLLGLAALVLSSVVGVFTFKKKEN